MLIGSGVTATSVSAFGPPPLGAVHLPLRKDDWSDTSLRVMYGLNGAGKTTVLRAVHGALSGIAAEGCDLFVNIEIGHDGLGWGVELIHSLCRCAREALGTDLDEIEQMAEDFDVVDNPQRTDHDDDTRRELLTAKMDQLRFDMAEIAGRCLDTDALPAVADLGLSLRAVGDAAAPRWDVYVSATPAPGTKLASIVNPSDENLESMRPSPGTQTLIEWLRDNESTQPKAAMHLDMFRQAFYGATWRPDWVPVRIARVGSIAASLSHIAVVAAGDDAEQAAARSIADLGERFEFASAWNEFDVELNEDLADELTRRSRRASILTNSFLGGPFPLSLRLSNPATWMTSPPLEWVHIDDRFPDPIPLSKLSAGQSRWAAAAIDIASAQIGDSLPVVLLVDEPERSLHPSATVALAADLSAEYRMDVSATTDLVHSIVATHSPAFLNLAGVPKLHVSRDSTGCARVDPVEFEDLSDPAKLAEQLGCTLSDVLSIVRRWIVVEGHHDHVIFQSAFRDELVVRQWQIITMDGAANSSAAVSNQFLLGYSTADMVVVLDGVDRKPIKLWQDAKAAWGDGSERDARGLLARLRDTPGVEHRYLGEAGLEALGRGHFDRVHAVGLPKRDVLDYLNPADLGLSETWAQLDRRFKKDLPGSRTGRERKTWLRKQGADLRDARLTAAARNLDGADFAELAQILTVGR